MNLNDMPHKVSDKFALGYVDTFYNDLLVPRKESATKVLEIGIWNGDSICLWRDFFSNATVYGMDISPPPGNPALYDENSRIKLITQTNAYCESSVDMVKELEPEGFDVIIDDGPHTFETMSYFLQHYLPMVKPGGVVVLEDIIDLNWTPKFLELIDSNVWNAVVHDMRGKQKNEELLNRWSNGLDVITVQKK